jgi:alkenylglycerophosphocholine/alkenylglycerophosphoethanolamine hydrolase
MNDDRMENGSDVLLQVDHQALQLPTPEPTITTPSPSLRFCDTSLFPLFLSVVALNCVELATNTAILVLILRPLPALVLSLGTFERSWLVAVGLLLGAVGDELLAVGYFVPGLFAFLLGHLCYIFAFVLDSKKLGVSSGIPALAYAAVLLAIVVPSAGGLAGPIIVYGLVLASMAWRASVGVEEHGVGGNLSLRATGGWMFVLSDSLIAVSKFVAPFAGSNTAISITYYLAQFLLAIAAPRVDVGERGTNGSVASAQAGRCVRIFGGGCAWHTRALGRWGLMATAPCSSG